jgi:hypothetical protein
MLIASDLAFQVFSPPAKPLDNVNKHHTCRRGIHRHLIITVNNPQPVIFNKNPFAPLKKFVFIRAIRGEIGSPSTQQEKRQPNTWQSKTLNLSPSTLNPKSFNLQH